MYRTKIHKKLFTITFLIFILTLPLSGCKNTGTAALSATPLDELLITDINSRLITGNNDTGYKTHTVARGDISASIQYSASAVSPEPETVLIPYTEGKITFVAEYLKANSSSLGKHDTLEAGERIATFRMNINSDELAEIKHELERAQIQYRTTKSELETELNVLKALKDSTTDINSDNILTNELNYRAALNEYNEYIDSAEAHIASLKEKYDLYSKGSFEFDVCAPSSGLVILSDDFKENDLIPPGSQIAYIYSLDNITFRIENSLFAYEGQTPIFNYGDKIYIETISARDTSVYPGTVICAPNVLYDTSIIYVTIKFDNYESAMKTFGSSSIFYSQTITGTYKIAQNVLTVPPDAVEFNYNADGSPANTGTVRLYNNGSVYKTNITYAYKDAENVWITSGLKEGDTVVIK